MAQDIVITSMLDFGAAIRGVRVSHGFTQSEMAEKLNVSHRWISELENGKPKRLDTEFIVRLMGLGVSMKLAARE